MAAEARATGRRAGEEVRATTRGRDPGRRRGGREPTCSLAHAYYLRGGAIPPPQFTSRSLSHHSPLPSRLLSPCFSRPHFPALGLLYASMCPTSTVHHNGSRRLGLLRVCSTILTSDSLQGEGEPK